jgi:hypothetical protein
MNRAQRLMVLALIALGACGGAEAALDTVAPIVIEEAV